MSPRSLLRKLFDAALAAALPAETVGRWLPSAPRGRTFVVGAGKAAASMAKAVENAWKGPLTGLVVTRYGHAVPTRSIEVVEAAHPIPDAAGERAARRILEIASAAERDDLVLCLISGGASALLSLPAEDISLEDKRAVSQALLRSGAPIDEMNCIRKRLSAIKGGRLGAAIAPAAAVSLLISDVPGDDPSIIGSGPTVVDDTGPDAAAELIARYRIEVGPDVARVLHSNRAITSLPENQSLHLIATPQMSLEASAATASALGVIPMILGDAIEGEAREAAKVMAGIARQVVHHRQPLVPPCVLLSGGETTVTVHGAGKGGPNAEFLLALAVALDGLGGVHAIACDTDGIDGSEDNAGAMIGPDTIRRARERGLNPRAYLTRNNAYDFFADLDDLVTTGPTLTNVNDFRAIYIE